jgi:hypothetical protein
MLLEKSSKLSAGVGFGHFQGMGFLGAIYTDVKYFDAASSSNLVKTC